MSRPCSSQVYQVTPTPASVATSSRRRPGVRQADLLGRDALPAAAQEGGQLVPPQCCNVPGCNVPGCNVPGCNVPGCNVPGSNRPVPDRDGSYVHQGFAHSHLVGLPLPVRDVNLMLLV
jgi:hypothetical protein